MFIFNKWMINASWKMPPKKAKLMHRLDYWDYLIFLFRKVFSIVDKDGSGFLSKREAKRACKLIGEKFGITEVNLSLWEGEGPGEVLHSTHCEGRDLAGWCWCWRRRPAQLRGIQDEPRRKSSDWYLNRSILWNLDIKCKENIEILPLAHSELWWLLP